MLYLGDVYENGTAREFVDNYDRNFGRFSSRTVPTLGNHEFNNRATGFDPYWKSKRGKAPPRFSNFYASGWQIIVLDSEESTRSGSDQYSWLQSVLASSPGRGNCRIAISHRPRYSTGDHGDGTALEPLYQLLSGKAKIFLSGHDHDMQVFYPERGITQFVSGAAGRGGYPTNNKSQGKLRWSNPKPGQPVSSAAQGALRLALTRGSRTRSARWKFISTNGPILKRGKIGCQSG
ncbi:MAG: metallophosphoesterase [Thermoleophilia bacterium]|nr:metallophosphoesterase [Thermoleophilia bacterium]